MPYTVLDFQIIKQCHTRSTYWTAKALTKALQDIGAEPYYYYPHSMIMHVTEVFTSDQEALERRRQIDYALTKVSHKGKSPAYLLIVY